MNLIFRISSLFCLLAAPAFARVVEVNVAPSDIYRGRVSRQVSLERYGIPDVKLLNPVYMPVKTLPEGADPAAADKISVLPGMERKQAFARILVPAYRKAAQGGYEVLSSFSLDVQDPPATAQPQVSAAKTTAVATPLANGTWYRIAVPDRGVYKIDHAFLQSLGITGAVSSANIRLVGNGGALLSENNAVPRPMDLSDNAIWVNDGGDGSFGSGDFLAFYCPGPTRWDEDRNGRRFIHNKHLYADSSYYFLSVDAGAGQRIANAPDAGTATTTVTSFNDYVAHEVDLYNPGKFGKEWWGERFGISSNAQPSRTFDFPLGAVVDTVRLRLSVASRSEVIGNQMSATLNGNTFTNYVFMKKVLLEDDNDPVDAAGSDLTLPVKSSTASLTLAYNASADAIGYLNYIELNWRRPLGFAGSNFTFRDLDSRDSGAVVAYQVSGADANTQIWDVTDPTRAMRMQGTLNGGIFSFVQDAGALHEFVALNGSTFGTPVGKGKVANQNLHAADAPQFVIVTHPGWRDAAERLANLHREHDGMRVLVATTDEVYNEFSSGAQDIAGIRDMMRYYYMQAGSDTSRMPRYLLLFGDASYDYKNRLSTNTNFVPTYESEEPVYVSASFTVDDFFGFLDDNENMSDFSIANTLELGVGRIPVGSVAEANDAVNKIEVYLSPASLGPWRMVNTYVGDNEDDAGNHLLDAEDIAKVVNSSSPYSNDAKVYLDNLNFVSTPSGYRCPDANKAINDQIFKGTFLINYTGHGSTSTLAHERILTNDDFSKWKNLNKLPFMVTATCDYARYDNPAYVSNGEKMVLKGDGGTIAMLTTTGPVYASVNRLINQQYLRAQYTQNADGSWPTFGDAMREGKNKTFRTTADEFTLLNFYRFTMLGDPAIQPSFPKHEVHTDSVLDMTTGLTTDSMRALGRYSLSGHVSDRNGALLGTFNGRAHVTIYDKPRLIVLQARETGYERRYYLRDNVIFKGVATVTNGVFSCSFIAPKDINYDYGKARISYYAENGQTDAAGMDSSVTSGGYTDGAPADNVPPIVKPFIGDTLFRDGGLTGSNTLLYVQLSDDNGINTSGNGVGHDLTAVLDGDYEHPINLNDYFIPEANTYQRGHISYPVSGLSDGAHTFWVKAWDVYNNSGTGEVRFVVGNGSVMKIEKLINYPNPFTENTRLFFEHNHPSEVLKVQLMIYDMAGRQVRHIETSYTPGGSHSNEIIWDGTSDSGGRLPGGVYPCRLMLSTESGVQGTAYQKMVIVR